MNSQEASNPTETFVRWMEELTNADVALVGGKNASLGELTRFLTSEGVRIPPAFFTTSAAYWRFVDFNDLRRPIHEQLDEYHEGKLTLQETGRAIRDFFLQGQSPPGFEAAILDSYQQLADRCHSPDFRVAVRSSATAEDLPAASFAGQHESFLNVKGNTALLDAVKACLASLFTDRAITYRDMNGFDHMKVALSVGVQQMVRSDQGSAGVIFTVDPETGFPDVTVVDASCGFGEGVVQGRVDPDEFVVFEPLLDSRQYVPIIERKLGQKALKIVAGDSATGTETVTTIADERDRFVLDDQRVLQLARWAKAIERHYGRAMDVEFAVDGPTGELFIVQARPETVQSRRGLTALKTYALGKHGSELVRGVSVGTAIATGTAMVVQGTDDFERFPKGAILVAQTTDPDWLPVMRRAAAVVTDHGGRTSHAAIVSRELGIPAVVGTGRATALISDGQALTVSCAGGEEGAVYDGIADFQVSELDLSNIPATKTSIMLNLGDPGAAFGWWQLPADGVGLARMEFIIGNIIKIHPMALARYESVKDTEARARIEQLTRGYADKEEYFVELLASGIARIAASQYPKRVIVRLSDFKTNEYSALIGGEQFEPREGNPMIGFRGASRYYNDRYRQGFALECRAIARVRKVTGLTNVMVMVPFCRTVDEALRVVEEMERNGLRRFEHGLELYLMCEIPSNVVLAEEFLAHFDGYSIAQPAAATER